MDEDVITTSSESHPNSLIIPLWQAWHYSLGQWKEYEKGKYIFLLKGKDYEKVNPGYFLRNISDKNEIADILEQSQNKKLQNIQAKKKPELLN